METKMLAVIAAVALLSAMIGGYMMQQSGVKIIREEMSKMSSLPSQAPAVVQQTPATTPAPATAPAMAAAPSTSEKKDVSGEIVLDEAITFSDMPWQKEVNLERGRYQVYFEADQPINFVVRSPTGSTKATTQFGPKCCDTSGFYTADINNGEEGTYTIVFDDSKLQLADAKPSQGLVKIGKISEI